MPTTFRSYSEALTTIQNAKFNITNSVDTSKSSWIEDANYYSCDGVNGFLIIETSKRDYIFKNVPIQIWNNFKNASSFGSFYNRKIRDNYQLVI